MNLVIQPSRKLRGEVTLPPNKSHSFRALIMAGLASGASRIVDPALSGDWDRGVKALEMFGANISHTDGNIWNVQGTGGALQTPEDVIDCGNSGIIFRFFMGVAAGCPGYTVLTGDHSIRHIRVGAPLIQALNNLGAFAVSTKGDGHAPVVVRGRIKGGFTEIDGMDSQSVSGLLIGCALAEGNSEIRVLRAGEKPWVGVTLHWFDRVGISYTNRDFEHYTVAGGRVWNGFETAITKDWSAALYPVVAALITLDSEIILKGLDLQDPQGDKKVLDVLRAMGADIEATPGCIRARTSALHGMEIDCNDFIDQFMLLALVGCFAEGETTLRNAEICRFKECDRITEMRKALSDMGADVTELRDGLVVRRSKLRGAVHHSRLDHRMVMTLAVAGLVAEEKTSISEAECVTKTFPTFVEQMRSLGARIAQG